MNTFKRTSPEGVSEIKPILRVVLLAFIASWILIVSGRLLVTALHTAPSFDGAMNLEVAHSLAQGEGYRRMYAPRHLFPHEIQTKAPYILPAAAVFRLFGVGIAQSEVVNVAYFIALAVLSCVLLRGAGGRATTVLGIGAILATPGLLRFGFAGYGEIPGLTWFLAATALYFWPKKSHEPRLSLAVATGALLALAYLTKTVMLIGIAVFGVAVLLDIYFHRSKGVRGSLAVIGSLAAGVVLPIAAFETWKLAALGGFGPWLDWWRTEYGNIIWQTGASASPEGHIGALIHKTLRHLEILSGFYGLSQWIVGLWLLLVVGVGLVALLKSRRERRYLFVTVILGTATIYFVWWLALTPDLRAWLRRIMNGMLLANLGMLLFACISVSRQTSNAVVKYAKTLLLLAFPAISFSQQSGRIVSQNFPDVENLLSTAKAVRELPLDAYIFGIGWDSAPVIAVFSGRNITNFNQVTVSRLDPDRPAYVVKQPGASASEPINHAFSMYGLTVPQSSNYGVYQVPSFQPDEMAFDPQKVRSVVTENDDYPYAQGAYKAVPGFGLWLASDNLIVLRGSSSEILKLTGYTPPLDKYLYAGGLHATVSFNGCQAPPAAVPNDKLFTLHFRIPADCPHPRNGIWQIRIEVDNVIDLSNPQGDHRSLSILAKAVGFVDAE